jgi:hypothetical protein
MPFECQTTASEEEPLLRLPIGVDLTAAVREEHPLAQSAGASGHRWAERAGRGAPGRLHERLPVQPGVPPAVRLQPRFRRHGRRSPQVHSVDNSRTRVVGVLGVVHAVGELRAALRRTRVRMLALSTTLEPALLKRVKNFSCRDRGRGQYPPPFHFHYTAQVGACGKSRVVPHNQRPQAGSYGKEGVSKCVCCPCRRTCPGARQRSCTV